MPASRSSKALYRLVINTDLANWVRGDALAALIDREEVEILESIASNTDLANWVREMALEGLKIIE